MPPRRAAATAAAASSAAKRAAADLTDADASDSKRHNASGSSMAAASTAVAVPAPAAAAASASQCSDGMAAAAAALAADADRIRSTATAALQQRQQSAEQKDASLAALRSAHSEAQERLRLEQQSQADLLREEQQLQMARLLREQRQKTVQLQAVHARAQQQAQDSVHAAQAALAPLRDLSARLSGLGHADVVAQEPALDALLAPNRSPNAAGRFLGVDVRLSGAHLLYRATCDGFEAKDFWCCCADKGATLMLVKAAGSGSIFGAFTPVSWPADANPGQWLADPSGRTFLFSLVNAHGRPVRLRLKNDEMHRERALLLDEGYGPGFGSGADLGLMDEQRAAEDAHGCYAFPQSFELDQQAEADAGLPPVPFAYDKTLLAGDDGQGRSVTCFAAAEIEVYLL